MKKKVQMNIEGEKISQSQILSIKNIRLPGSNITPKLDYSKGNPKTIYQISTFNFTQRSCIKFLEKNIPIHSNR